MSKWSLYKKIKVVVDYRNMGYIVDADNKKQLESAVGWASKYKSSGSDSFEPIIKEFDNEGFKIALCSSAGGSSQGGKLSFWTCKVEKDGFTFYTGVNADMLLDFMMTSTMVDGVFTREASFARKDGNVGILHSDMQQYQQALSDMEQKEAVTKTKKTSTRESGYHYYLNNVDDMYISKMYRWCRCDIDGDGCWGYNKVSIVFTNEPVVCHWIKPMQAKPTFTKLSQYIQSSKSFMHLEEKTPARICSAERVEIDVDTNYIDSCILEYYHDSFYQQKAYMGRASFVQTLAYHAVSTQGDKRPEQLEAEILRLVREWNDAPEHVKNQITVRYE